jgi:hypothetical protein
MNRFAGPTSMVFAFFAGILLLFAQTAFWVTSTLNNQTYFINTLVQVFQKEEVREVVAKEILNQAFAQRPILQRLSGSFIEPALIGILGSTQFENVLRLAANKYYDFAIAQSPQDFYIDISQFKQTVALLTTLTNTEDRLNVTDLPDQILIVNASHIPDIHRVITFAVWAGPILLLIGIIFLIAAIALSKDPLKETMRAGFIVAGLSFLFYLAIPYINNGTSSTYFNTNTRIIFSELYTAFTQPLVNNIQFQIFIALVIAIGAMIIRIVMKNKMGVTTMEKKTERTQKRSK